jgi:hypothetical protein
MSEIGPWLAEIELVKLHLLNWLREQAVAPENDPNSSRLLCDVIKKTNVLDAIILGVGETIWLESDADEWLGEEYEYSDVWACAISDALREFKREASNA